MNLNRNWNKTYGESSRPCWKGSPQQAGLRHTSWLKHHLWKPWKSYSPKTHSAIQTHTPGHLHMASPPLQLQESTQAQAQAHHTLVGRTGKWLVSQQNCPTNQTLNPRHILCLFPFHLSTSKASGPYSNFGGTPLLWYNPKQVWQTCLQAAPPPTQPPEFCCHTTCFSTQTHAPSYPSGIQHCLATPEDYIGTGSTHTSWKNRLISTCMRIHSITKRAI